MNLHELAKETAKQIRADPFNGCPTPAVLTVIIESALQTARKQGYTEAAEIAVSHLGNDLVAEGQALLRKAILSARDRLDTPTTKRKQP